MVFLFLASKNTGDSTREHPAVKQNFTAWLQFLLMQKASYLYEKGTSSDKLYCWYQFYGEMISFISRKSPPNLNLTLGVFCNIYHTLRSSDKSIFFFFLSICSIYYRHTSGIIPECREKLQQAADWFCPHPSHVWTKSLQIY